MQPKAFLFDLNGTMIHDMPFHCDAWYDTITNDLKHTISREAMEKEMYGKNEEVLVRIFGEGRFTMAEMVKIGFEKELKYQKNYLQHMQLIKGLDAILAKAKTQGIKMAIGSAAIMFNINFIIDGLQIRHYFDALVSADDVQISKPNPEVFLKCAAILGVAPEDCVVFEDAPKGVEAAQNAGMRCVVITTMHEKEEFAHYNNVIAFVEDYTSESLQNLLFL